MITPKDCDKILEMTTEQFAKDNQPDALTFKVGLSHYAIRQLTYYYDVVQGEKAIEGMHVDDISLALNLDMDMLKRNKPDERSEAARHWAVCITEMEKVVAYFDKFIAGRKE
jgi:hypothetical protein